MAHVRRVVACPTSSEGVHARRGEMRRLEGTALRIEGVVLGEPRLLARVAPEADDFGWRHAAFAARPKNMIANMSVASTISSEMTIAGTSLPPNIV